MKWIALSAMFFLFIVFLEEQIANYYTYKLEKRKLDNLTKKDN